MWERHKTAQRNSMFLLLENKNCFPITIYCSIGGLWKNPESLHANAIISFPTVPILSHYLKRFKMESRFLPSSLLSGRMFFCKILLFQLNLWCEKLVAAWYCAVIWKQLLISNERIRVRWVILDLSQDEACTDLFDNLSVNTNERPFECYHFQPTSSLICQYL